MSEISILAIDLAKNSFQVCDVKVDGVAVFNKSVSRSRLLQLLLDHTPCIVAMEACATSHYWGRMAQGQSTEVRIIPASQEAADQVVRRDVVLLARSFAPIAVA